MSSPTQFYTWTFPAEGQDPWYQAFDDYASAVDVTVRSVEQLIGPKYTLVYSTNGALLISSATINANPAGAYYTPLSSSPAGRFVGSFTIVRSGAQALFTWAAQGRWDHVLDTITRNDGRLAFRGIINGGAVTSLAFPVDSLAWSHNAGVTEIVQQYRWTTAVSLGQGAYSVEMQATVMSVTTGASSEWRASTTDRFGLELLETVA